MYCVRDTSAVGKLFLQCGDMHLWQGPHNTVKCMTKMVGLCKEDWRKLLRCASGERHSMHSAVSHSLGSLQQSHKVRQSKWRMDREHPLIIPLKPSRLPTTCCSIQDYTAQYIGSADKEAQPGLFCLSMVYKPAHASVAWSGLCGSTRACVQLHKTRSLRQSAITSLKASDSSCKIKIAASSVTGATACASGLHCTARLQHTGAALELPLGVAMGPVSLILGPVGFLIGKLGRAASAIRCESRAHMCMSLPILIMHSICSDDNRYTSMLRIDGSLITDC